MVFRYTLMLFSSVHYNLHPYETFIVCLPSTELGTNVGSQATLLKAEV